MRDDRPSFLDPPPRVTLPAMRNRNFSFSRNMRARIAG